MAIATVTSGLSNTGPNSAAAYVKTSATTAHPAEGATVILGTA